MPKSKFEHNFMDLNIYIYLEHSFMPSTTHKIIAGGHFTFKMSIDAHLSLY